MGHDRFVVAYTTNTLIIADMSNSYCSEIEWQSAGNERFYFDNEHVCMIINAGEVCIFWIYDNNSDFSMSSSTSNDINLIDQICNTGKWNMSEMAVLCELI